MFFRRAKIYVNFRLSCLYIRFICIFASQLNKCQSIKSCIMYSQKKKKTLFQNLVIVFVPLVITVTGAHLSEVDTQILDAISKSVVEIVDVVSQ